MLTDESYLSALKVFGRAFVLSAALMGSLAGALGVSTYTLSAMSETLWAAEDDSCAVPGERDLVAKVKSTARRELSK